jgi:hypothetical protein
MNGLIESGATATKNKHTNKTKSSAFTGYKFPTAATSNKLGDLGIIIGAFNEKEEDRKGNKQYNKTDSKANFQSAVLLPMPNSIQDAQGHLWQEYSVTDMIGEGVAAAGDAVSSFGGARGAMVGSFIKGAGAAMQTSGTANKLARRVTGIGLDPNTRLEYTGEAMREFTFNFTMIPESQADSEAIRNIIKFFRVNGTGATTLGGDSDGSVTTGLDKTTISDLHAFITEPGWFTIDFRNKYLNSMFMPDQMVLTAFSTSLFEDGYAAFFDDQSPKKVSMSMTFKERIPKYQNSW